MTKWVTKKLGEIVIPTKGRLTEQSSSYLVGWQPLINTSAIEGEAKDWANPNQGILCEPNDVLMLWDGERSGLVINGKTGVVGSTFARLRPNNEILGKLLYYILDFNFEWIQNRRTGTGVPHAPKDLMRILEISFPESLAEQRRIAAILGSADKVIATSEALIEKYKHIKQGLLTDLLQPKEGWKKVKLGECVQVFDGTHQTPYYVEDGIPFYSVENVTANDFDHTKYITEEEHALLTQSHRIEKGDILMTRIGSIGNCKLVDWNVNASFYVSLALMKVKTDYDAKFLVYYSQTDDFNKAILHESLTFAYPQKINLGKINEVIIYVPYKDDRPDLSEQRRIASILSSIDAKILAEEKVVEKYKGVKKGLMNEQLTMNN